MVTVPVLSLTLVSQTKLEPVSSLERRGGEAEGELVRVAAGAARDVLGIVLGHRPPVVDRPPDYHGLLEGDVRHTDDPLHQTGALHEGVLQADLLPADGLQEVAGAARLGEHRHQGEIRVFSGAVEASRQQGLRDWGANLDIRQVHVQVGVGSFGHFGDVVHEDFHLGQVQAKDVCKPGNKNIVFLETYFESDLTSQSSADWTSGEDLSCFLERNIF